MILIISKKNDLISYGFYKAYKTIYKYVDIIYDKTQINKDKEYTQIIINNFEFFDNIPINVNIKYILINEYCLFENKLKNNDIKYLIIKEYSKNINFDNFNKLDKYMYQDNNIVIFPFCSIFTKNEILWHYKKFIIKNKKIPKNIITYDNTSNFAKDLVKINYKKNIYDINKLIDLSFNDKNIYLSFYDINKFDYKSISFMALGNYSMTNSNIDENFYVFKIGQLENVDFNKIVQNIEIIYNDFTFEKYVKVLNNYFLSVV